jgi:hypothetical protein
MLRRRIWVGRATQVARSLQSQWKDCCLQVRKQSDWYQLLELPWSEGDLSDSSKLRRTMGAKPKCQGGKHRVKTARNRYMRAMILLEQV